MTSNKFVYSFGDNIAEGDSSMKNILGGKGANLAEMSKLNLPVPLGFTITTKVCDFYYKHNKSFPNDLDYQVTKALNHIENKLNGKFGDSKYPLLFSVRSGARASMPGMMDTILNLGLNDITVKALAERTNNKRFALDSYRRFIQMYSNVVLELDHYTFELILDNKKQELGISLDTLLEENHLEEIIDSFKELVKNKTGNDFPQDVNQQLWGAIRAVFNSWMNDRAITYRDLNNIPESWGTAVNIQSMVFGNMGNDCATGVAFSRNPSTGDREFYGEYLINAQGEDVVAGIRTPQEITKLGRIKSKSELVSMEESMPNVYNELVKIYKKLELHYRDMQDIEFTVQNNKLWMLQTRSGKRTAKAAIKIAVDMVKEGLIDKEEAIKRLDPESLDQLLHPTLDPNANVKVIATGLPASPGAASGIVVFSSQDAERLSDNKKVILVRSETSPEDIKGMHVSQGILTSRGGMTSHAAVVARGMGKPCISGASDVIISYKEKQCVINKILIKEGDIITINGSTGDIIIGEVPTLKPQLSDDFRLIMTWSDKIRKLKVRTNAETPIDCKTAIDFGAEGIGLCRTEHMFFEDDRITFVREMILAEDINGRKNALDKLLPIQQKDYEDIFTIMDNLPINIRLLDPPLHEFLPHNEEEIEKVAKVIKMSKDYIKKRVLGLREENPMLGHRGCRLGITYPEIYEMQVKAIFKAALTVKKKKNINSSLEIMIPLIFGKKELIIIKNLITKVAKEIESTEGIKLSYIIGTMIELPRAALMADDIASEADFFSFGTNDLTQTTFGISRDDSASFLGCYNKKGILEKDPFAELDRNGVGELIKIATVKGRSVKDSLKLGICGEHGGNANSIYFCHNLEMNYVSCSPYRVPIARLAAARAALI